MRASPWLALALGCGASSTLAATDAGAPDAAPVTACLPPCLARALAPCAPPVGACSAYVTAAPDNWRRCFDNGLVVEAQPQGGQRYRQGRAVCASIEAREGSTVRTEVWRDAAGRTIASVSIPFGRGVWIVGCGAESYTVDPASPACAGDPWVRAHNPHALPCPLDRGDACRAR